MQFKSHQALLAFLRDHSHSARLAAVVDVSRYASPEACENALGLAQGELERLHNFHAGFAPPHRRVGPRWIDLDREGEHLLFATREAFDRQSVSFFVLDTHPGEAIGHLASLVKMKQPDGSRQLFRWHDAFVLAALIPLLDEAQKCDLLGPLNGWLTLDPCKNAIQLRIDRTDRQRARPFQLSQSQLDGLSLALHPYTILDQIREIDSSLLPLNDTCASLARVHPVMEAARRHGLSAPSDVSLYAALALQLPPDFDASGPIADALTETKKGHLTFHEAVARIPVEAWRAWDDELNSTGELR